MAVRTTFTTSIGIVLLRPHARLGVRDASPLSKRGVDRLPAKIERPVFPRGARDVLCGRSTLCLAQLRRGCFIYVSCYVVLYPGAGVARIGARGHRRHNTTSPQNRTPVAGAGRDAAPTWSLYMPLVPNDDDQFPEEEDMPAELPRPPPPPDSEDDEDGVELVDLNRAPAPAVATSE